MRLNAPPNTDDSNLNRWLHDLYTAAVSNIGTISPTWGQTNTTSGQTAALLYIIGSAVSSEIVMPTSGDIVGASVASDRLRTAGSLSVRPRINGAVNTDIVATLDGTNTQYANTLVRHSLVSFVTGDRLSMEITTSADWAPTTSNIACHLFILF